MIALVIALAVVVVGGAGAGAYALLIARPGTPAAHSSSSATPTATITPILNSPLTTQDDGWPLVSDHCFLGQDGYHVKNNSKQSGYTGWYCEAPMYSVADASISVTVDDISGATNQPYGIRFRFDDSAITGYWFVVDALGHWALFRQVKGKYTRLQDYTFSSAIHRGLNVKNTLTVVFRGQHISCMVNGITVGDLIDPGSSLGAGLVALEVGDNVDAVFTNFLALP